MKGDEGVRHELDEPSEKNQPTRHLTFDNSGSTKYPLLDICADIAKHTAAKERENRKK